VQFGDGITGARLPTGVANVRAVYRTGGDLAGEVRAGQLSLPISRSGGVTGVTNPAASAGGDDPETADSGRISAPLRVTTIDRVVSLADYALFARAFPGVAKAQAVWARAASHRGVLITAAGNHGAVLSPAAGIGKYLLAAIQQAGDPLVPAALARYVPKSFRVAANVRTDPDRVRADVLAAVSASLSQAFSFEARDLGQDVAASEVLAAIQGVAGVVAATITALWMFDPGKPTAPPSGPPPDLLPASTPLPGADIGTVTGAWLLVIDSAPINWGVLP
jgi:predicted phage baseplate assembly protein